MRIDFPLYAIRKYACITYEFGYKIIQTHRNKYVLDYEDSDILEYRDRRVALLREELPYKLYPISKLIYSVSDMYESKTKIFLDRTGNIVRWIPNKMFPVVSRYIDNIWTNPSGYKVFTVLGLSTKFVIDEYRGEKYASIMQIGKRNILFGLTDTSQPNTRRKL